jgi:hypothetical protein
MPTCVVEKSGEITAFYAHVPLHEAVRFTLAGGFMASPYLSCYVAIGAVLCASLVWLVLPTSQAADLLVEGGLVETATVVMYGVAIFALFWYRSAVSDRLAWAALLIVAVAFGAREMDLHLAWTDISMLKSRFYLGAAPAHQKLAGFLAAATTIAALLYLAARYGAPTLRLLRRQSPYAVTAAVFLATLVVSKMLDRSVSILTEDAGIAISAAAQVLVQSIEEMLELALPALIVLGLLQQRSRVLISRT